MAPYKAAKAQNDQATMDKLTALAGEIDDVLDQLAIIGMGAVAAGLPDLTARVEAATMTSLSWPFGQGIAPANHERLFRDSLPENDADDQGPTEPPPPPP